MKSLMLDILFPKKCVGCKKIGSFLCGICFSYIQLYQSFLCPVCLKPSIEGKTHYKCKGMYTLDGLLSGVIYSGASKKLLTTFKYKPYVSALTNTLGELLCEALNQNELFFQLLQEMPLVTSVPLYSRKEKKRGYNHSSLLASYVAQYFNQEINTKLLIRTKETKPQFKLSALERTKNIKNAFEINCAYEKIIQKRVIILVDDVATTCTTLSECAKVLKKAGAHKVYGVTFAKEL